MAKQESKYYWCNGIAFLALLGKHGYHWQGGSLVGDGQSVVEKGMEDKYAYVISVNHDAKTIGIFPLEIYQPGSPTADREKYQRIVDLCADFENMEPDILAAEAQRTGAL